MRGASGHTLKESIKETNKTAKRVQMGKKDEAEEEKNAAHHQKYSHTHVYNMYMHAYTLAIIYLNLYRELEGERRTRERMNEQTNDRERVKEREGICNFKYSIQLLYDISSLHHICSVCIYGMLTLSHMYDVHK